MKYLAHVLLVAVLCMAALDAGAQGLSYRPGREFRSLNTESYEIAVQKNGRLDVVLANGEPVFTNVFPMVWFEQKDAPKLLTVDGRYSQRFEVNDRLGQGQGMLLKKDECEWYLHAYPSKPFLAAQVVYVNDTKKPVAVKALMPWCVGTPKKGWLSLGEETLSSLRSENAIAIHAASADDPPFTPGSLAMLNPQTGRVLVAGFLSDGSSLARIEVSQEGSGKKAESALNPSFRGICEFDPPVVLEPGERLESDVLYLALTETNPLTALERYAAATVSANELRHEPGLLPYRWLPGSDRIRSRGLETLEAAMGRPAVPVDLFERDRPRIWSLPIGPRANQGHVVALYNWNDSAAEQVQIPFGKAGLEMGAYYTVYDVSQDAYYGTASDVLNVTVPAGGTRLIGLRKFLERPMVLSIPHSIKTRDARTVWDAANDRLSGTFDPNTTGGQTLRILVPAPYVVKDVTTESAPVDWKMAENILTLAIGADAQVPAEWTAQF